MALTAKDYFENANQLQIEGRFQEALKEYRQALKMDPSLLGAQINIGTILGELNRWEEAAKELRAVLAQKPNLDTAAYALGLACMHTEKFDEAQELLQQALDQGRIHDAAPRLLDVTREIYWQKIAGEFDALRERFAANSNECLPEQTYRLLHAAFAIITRGPNREDFFVSNAFPPAKGLIYNLLSRLSGEEKEKVQRAADVLTPAFKKLNERPSPYVSPSIKVTLKNGDILQLGGLSDCDNVIGSAFECLVGNDPMFVPFADLNMIKFLRDGEWIETELHYKSGKVGGALAPSVYPRAFLSKEPEVRGGLRWSRHQLTPEISLGVGAKHYRSVNHVIPITAIKQMEMLFEI